MAPASTRPRDQPRPPPPPPLKRALYAVLRVWFTGTFVFSVLVTSAATRLVHALVFLSKRTREQWSARVAGAGFRFIFALNPHIRFEYADEGEPQWERVFAEEGARPFMLVNHTSPLDSLVYSALVPMGVIGGLRTLAKYTLFRLPVFGWILRSAGHYPVYFNNVESATDFSVDKAAQERIARDVDEHIRLGGGLTLFPEGAINRVNSNTLQSFRRGAFETFARKHQMRLWGFLHTGVDKVWPTWATVGGFPGKIRFKLFPLPDPPADASLAEYVEHCQRVMQLELDLLLALDDPAATPADVAQIRAKFSAEIREAAHGDEAVARQLRDAVTMEHRQSPSRDKAE